MKKMGVLFFFTALLFGLTAKASKLLSSSLLLSPIKKDTISQDSLKKKRIYNTMRTPIAPKINGKLDDECWKLGEWQSDFAQYGPVHGGKSSHKTEFKVLFDDKYVYAAIRAFDDVQKISKRYNARDQFGGDIVGITMDSYFDHRTAFEFDLTSTGQKLDLLIGNDSWDTSWNAVWDGKVGIQDSCWVSEFRIPLSQLRYSEKNEQVWGLHVWRWIDRIQEETNWNLVPNDGSGALYEFGELHGIKSLKKSRRIELSPYTLGRIATNKRDPENPFSQAQQYTGTIGLDAKIGITNNFTLDATINPDFGQVEADPSVMNLSAFETYLEEKRAFFLEGKNIFNFQFGNDNVFYSRRIGHRPSYDPKKDWNQVKQPENTSIIGAFKLSGKTENGLSLGILSSTTRPEFARIYTTATGQENKQLVEPLSHYFVTRLQKDIDKGNTVIGGIYTQVNRELSNDKLNFLNKSASVIGLDLSQYWKERKYFLEAKAVGSSVAGPQQAMIDVQRSSARYFQRPGADYLHYDSTINSFSGYGASVKIGRGSKGHWRYNTELMFKTPGLEMNDLGYMQMADQIKHAINGAFVVREPALFYRNYSFWGTYRNLWNFDGKRINSVVNLGMDSEFKNNWGIYANIVYTSESYDSQCLRGGASMLTPGSMQYAFRARSDYSKNWFFAWGVYCSKANEGASSYKSVDAEVSFRPIPILTLSANGSYAKNYNELQYFDEKNGTPILSTIDNRDLNLVFRANLNLNTNLSIQYYGSPFLSLGEYSDFKKITQPLASKLQDRYVSLTNQATDNNYRFDLDGKGNNVFTADDRNFNFMQFRSNLVMRWEYKPGSSLYLVWAQDRTDSQTVSNFAFNDAQQKLWNIFPKNYFLLKLNYWFSV